MYLRDTKQTFKPNVNLKKDNGFLYHYLDNEKTCTKVILIQFTEQDLNLPLKQLYNKYTKMMNNTKEISILEFFEVKQGGEDVQTHIMIVDSQLKHIKQNFFKQKEQNKD